MDISKYKVIIFDVGDTLLTRKPSSAEILIERCKEANVYIEIPQAISACKSCELWIGEQIMRELSGAPRMSDEEFSINLDYIAIKEIFKDKPENELSNIAEKVHMINGKKQEWFIIDGIYETLEALKLSGFILGIVSNFSKTLLDILERLNLVKFFDDITISSMVNIEKPNPEILYIACKNLNVDPKDCLYVGDHPFDILCAKKANMDIAWICSDNDIIPNSILYKEDYRISSVKSLIT